MAKGAGLDTQQFLYYVLSLPYLPISCEPAFAMDIGYWWHSRSLQQEASLSIPWAFPNTKGWDRTSGYELLVDREPKDKEEAETGSQVLLVIMF